MEERTIEDISHEIQRKREEMLMIANEYGLTHELTLRNSQDLDQLILEYQMYSIKKKRGTLISRYAKRYYKVFHNRLLRLNNL